MNEQQVQDEELEDVQVDHPNAIRIGDDFFNNNFTHVVFAFNAFTKYIPIITAINMGIDSYLEAVVFSRIPTRPTEPAIRLRISRETIGVLIRRLLEAGEKQTEDSALEFIVNGIFAKDVLQYKSNGVTLVQVTNSDGTVDGSYTLHALSSVVATWPMIINW